MEHIGIVRVGDHTTSHLTPLPKIPMHGELVTMRDPLRSGGKSVDTCKMFIFTFTDGDDPNISEGMVELSRFRSNVWLVTGTALIKTELR